jgi:glyoxylase-like metal-dependent hydrolase (beta-lactamase superfamily II)
MRTVPPAPARLPRVGAGSVAIESPTMFEPYPYGSDVEVLPAYLPVPGMGVIPANSFVIHAEQPVLVDTGPGGLVPHAYETALRAVIDPAELRWLWLTHTDPDHVGGLAWLLEAAPQVRVVTTYLAAGKLSMHVPVPLDRCHFANPGDAVHVGDRKLVAVAPATFDAPETTAIYDTRSTTLFSADMFGALLAAPAVDARDLVRSELEDGLVRWSTIDSPWLHRVDRSQFADELARLHALSPRHVLGSHLPPVTGAIARLIDLLSTVPDAAPFVGPDQSALEAMLAANG